LWWWRREPSSFLATSDVAGSSFSFMFPSDDDDPCRTRIDCRRRALAAFTTVVAAHDAGNDDDSRRSRRSCSFRSFSTISARLSEADRLLARGMAGRQLASTPQTGFGCHEEGLMVDRIGEV
jgi:hypothetical protein